MNREPYGKKCKCGHHESDHVGEMKYQEVSIVQAKVMFGVLSYMESMSKRSICKICNCSQFQPIKKERGFFK